MKKMIAFMLLLLLFLTACGGKTSSAFETGADEPGQTVPENQGEKSPEEPEKVKDGEVQESDFQINDLGDETCEISHCYAEVRVITVPETLYGKTVVGLASSSFALLPVERLELPDTIQYLKKNAISNCENLKEIELGKGLLWVEQTCFLSLPKLQTIVFPEGMQEIRGFCFGFCDALTEVTIPGSVTEIPYGITSLAQSPNIVIITPAGSAAEAAAQEKGLPVRNP